MSTAASGTAYQVTLLSEAGSTVGLMKSKVSARDVQIFDPGVDKVAWLKAAGRTPQSGEPAVTVARFSRRGGLQIDIGVIAEYPAGQGAAQAAIVGEAVAKTKSG